MNAPRSFHAGLSCLPGCLLLLAGCQSTPKSNLTDEQLRQRALFCLKRGLEYEQNPVIRAQAVEALQEVDPESVAWIREALRDPEPGVRFAACMALGMLRDKNARQLLLTRVEDEDPNVRVAAVFALHRLKDYRYTSQLADALLTHHDPTVRANAAIALGRLGEKPSIRLLRRTKKDKDDRVHMQGLEARARLGDEQAIKNLIIMTHGTAGAPQAFAALALGRAGVKRAADALRTRLEEGPHIETKLAAARALGMLGYPDGYELALKYLTWKKAGLTKPPEESPEIQTMRVRSNAALALGAIGHPAALPHLHHLMENYPDPRVQLCAAKAIIEILNRTIRRPRSASPNPIAHGKPPAREAAP